MDGQTLLVSFVHLLQVFQAVCPHGSFPLLVSAPRTFVFTIRGHIYCLVSLYLSSQVHCCYNLCLHITGFPQTAKETLPGNNSSELSAELTVDTTPHTGQQCTILTRERITFPLPVISKLWNKVFLRMLTLTVCLILSAKPKMSLLACLMPHYYIP